MSEIPDSGFLEVGLLGGFSLGLGVALPKPVQRLLAFLALHPKPVAREFLAFSLWPNVADRKASASLRTAMWSASRLAPNVVITEQGTAQLAPKVSVDFDRCRCIAYGPSLADVGETGRSLIEAFGSDLLPGWYDEWVLRHRDSWSELRVRALESLGRAYLRRSDFLMASHAAVAAIAVDATRESARRLLIESYLAEGNWAQARAAYDRFAVELGRELGIAPSERLRELVEPPRSRNRTYDTVDSLLV